MTTFQAFATTEDGQGYIFVRARGQFFVSVAPHCVIIPQNRIRILRKTGEQEYVFTIEYGTDIVVNLKHDVKGVMKKYIEGMKQHFQECPRVPVRGSKYPFAAKIDLSNVLKKTKKASVQVFNPELKMKYVKAKNKVYPWIDTPMVLKYSEVMPEDWKPERKSFWDFLHHEPYTLEGEIIRAKEQIDSCYAKLNSKGYEMFLFIDETEEKKEKVNTKKVENENFFSKSTIEIALMWLGCALFMSITYFTGYYGFATILAFLGWIGSSFVLLQRFLKDALAEEEITP